MGNVDDLLIGLQLTHSGRYSYCKRLIAFHDPILDPTTVGPDYLLLDDDYLARLPESYVAAAKLARNIGFQFVDIKQCHRYLLSELLAARTRPGRYGGSLANRTRLAREIITRIRSEVPDLMIATRLNVYDGVPPEISNLPCTQGRGVGGEGLGNASSVWGADKENALIPNLEEPLAWVGEMEKL